MRKLPGLLRITLPPELPPIRTGASKMKKKVFFFTKPPRWVSQGGSRPKVTMALATSVVKKKKLNTSCDVRATKNTNKF